MAKCLHEKYNFKTTKCPECAYQFNFADVIQLLYGHIQRLDYQKFAGRISPDSAKSSSELINILEFGARLDHLESVQEEICLELDKIKNLIDKKAQYVGYYPAMPGPLTEQSILNIPPTTFESVLEGESVVEGLSKIVDRIDQEYLENQKAYKAQSQAAYYPPFEADELPKKKDGAIREDLTQSNALAEKRAREEAEAQAQ